MSGVTEPEMTTYTSSGIVDIKCIKSLMTGRDGDDIYCCGFVFSLPSKRKKFPTNNLNLENFSSCASELHFMFFSEFQGYRCKTGRTPHGTTTLKNFATQFGITDTEN